MRSFLFDRFESARDPGLNELARDLADLLGARRAFGDHAPGVLNWGLPSMIGLSPSSNQDRRIIAGYIAAAVEQFEPRLQNVSVLPVDDVADFAFQVEADLVASDDETVTLRILSPRRGGGLGASVLVVGDRRY